MPGEKSYPVNRDFCSKRSVSRDGFFVSLFRKILRGFGELEVIIVYNMTFDCVSDDDGVCFLSWLGSQVQGS